VRKNKFDEAFKLLELAEELYNRLSIFSYPDALLPGFRRKLDVYRRVIDDWKKFLIDMVSRKNLIDVLKVCYRD
ncbi:MAG: haloacid dehalogenase, partial [Ignisphaera sp.]